MNEYGNSMIALEDEKGQRICFNVDLILKGIEKIYKVEQKVNSILSILNPEELKIFINFTKELNHLSAFFDMVKEVSSHENDSIKCFIY